jgi:hypothetical protein
MRVTIGESEAVPFRDWDGTAVLSPGPEEILIARDEAMESHWVLALQDPYDHGDGFIYEPYEMVVVGFGLTLLTVVSPDDTDEFTATIIERLLAEATPPS